MGVRRSDLCVGYRHQAPPKSLYSSSSSVSGLLGQSMPMMAMFLRNKFLAWFAFIQSFYHYLNFVPDENNANSDPNEQSPSIRVLMSLIGLFVCYMGLVFPQPPPPSLKKASDAIAATTTDTTDTTTAATATATATESS